MSHIRIFRFLDLPYNINLLIHSFVRGQIIYENRHKFIPLVNDLISSTFNIRTALSLDACFNAYKTCHYRSEMNTLYGLPDRMWMILPRGESFFGILKDTKNKFFDVELNSINDPLDRLMRIIIVTANNAEKHHLK